MQTLEHRSDESGHTYRKMMERAGSGLADVVKSKLSTTQNNILILVGPGNNGGDGLVAARILQDAHVPVTVYLSRNRNTETDEVYHQAVAHDVNVVDE